MNWIHHYTGSDFWEKRMLSTTLYASRNTKSEKLDFVRISGIRWMIGLFLGRTNCHFGTLSRKGWEFFTTSIHFGWGSASLYERFFQLLWDRQYTSYTLVIGNFFIGSETDRWLLRIKQWFSVREMEKMAEEYERMFARNHGKCECLGQEIE